MKCEDCIHDGVCHIQEMSTGLEMEEYLREFGCEDFKNKADFVEVKEARWKGAGMGMYYCSLCQEEVCGNSFKYCPHCGAKMD